MKFAILIKYIDEMQRAGEFGPQKRGTVFANFKALIVWIPEEYILKKALKMYSLSFGGMLVLIGVYNPQIKQLYWITDRELLTNK